MASDRLHMRRLSCYFTNGTAQAFTNRVDQQFARRPEAIELFFADGSVVIERKNLCYFRETQYWQEAKPEPQQLPAAEAPVRSDDHDLL